MTVQERILTIRLSEKIKHDPEHAKKLGIENKVKIAKEIKNSERSN